MKIVLVEDEPKLAKNIQTFLEKNHFLVETYADGDEGYIAIESYGNEYSMLILDGNLPGKDGFSICRELRDSGFKKPILFLTARDTIAEKVLGLGVGADDYLVKPFDFEELLARIQALLRSSEKPFTEILVHAALQLNPATRMAQIHNTQLDLTDREFSILEYLLRHKNQIVSRDTVLAIAWDMSFDATSNVVDVHIANIRKKIDAENQESYIKTIRGRGYTIREE